MSLKCVLLNKEFDSLAEAGYYVELLDRERKGDIRDIELQPSWDLYAASTIDEGVAKIKIGRYTADFKYYCKSLEKVCVVDIKGQVPKTKFLRNGRTKRVAGGKGWTAFRLRCKILEANYGIEVQVVEGEPYTKLAKAAGARVL